jgi:Amt family ammonium transporter
MVMFMQAGFALVETGLCRARNAAHTVSINFLIYPLACASFWAYGFALGWGNWNNGPVAPGWYSTLGPGTSTLNTGIGLNPQFDASGKPTGVFDYGLLGTKGFFLLGVEDVSVFALFFFMMVFLDTAATIPTGVLAERWSWNNFLLFGLWVPLPYCIFANWVWGGGWLAQMGINWGLGHGAVDFAGSGVVHVMGAVIGLAGVLLLGPRRDKYTFRNGKRFPVALPGHNLPMVVLGTLILAFGWFGFNGGSTLSGTDLRISVILVNTMLGGVFGTLAALVTLQLRGFKADPSMLCNGMLAGLVGITASCAFVDSWAAALIGAISGVLVVFGVLWFEERGIDDPVGALSVHGLAGCWGVVAVGLFANGRYGAGWNGVVQKGYATDGVRGLFYGDFGQLVAQLLMLGVVIVFGFTIALVLFRLSTLLAPLRVAPEVEQVGLDVPEMGSMAYPESVLR